MKSSKLSNSSTIVLTVCCSVVFTIILYYVSRADFSITFTLTF